MYPWFWDTWAFLGGKTRYCFWSCVKHCSLFYVSPVSAALKGAAGWCCLVCRVWRLARSSACIMYLALLLCQSHVNLCAVSIQELNASRAMLLFQLLPFCASFLHLSTFWSGVLRGTWVLEKKIITYFVRALCHGFINYPHCCVNELGN